VIFATPFQGEVPSQRFVSLSRVRARYASMGWLGFLVTAGALRRARRRKPSAGAR
jgi:hypothetical protein